ncbi:protein dispatched homolog 1-like [Argonauta hians]
MTLLWNKMTNCYSRLLVYHHCAVLCIITLLGIAALLISYFLGEGFDFEQPRAGFETRGTEISNGVIAFSNLQSASETSLSLAPSLDRDKFRYRVPTKPSKADSRNTTTATAITTTTTTIISGSSINNSSSSSSSNTINNISNRVKKYGKNNKNWRRIWKGRKRWRMKKKKRGRKRSWKKKRRQNKKKKKLNGNKERRGRWWRRRRWRKQMRRMRNKDGINTRNNNNNNTSSSSSSSSTDTFSKHNNNNYNNDNANNNNTSIVDSENYNTSLNYNSNTITSIHTGTINNSTTIVHNTNNNNNSTITTNNTITSNNNTTITTNNTPIASYSTTIASYNTTIISNHNTLTSNNNNSNTIISINTINNNNTIISASNNNNSTTSIIITSTNNSTKHSTNNNNKGKVKRNRKRKKKKKKKWWNRMNDRLKNATSGYFCDDLDEKYSRIVFQTCEGCSLFTLENIQAMCRLERRVFYSTPLFQYLSIDHSRECRSWSIGNYISLLSNKSSCESLEPEDISLVLDTLRECAEFYRNYSLSSYCYDCADVPDRCKEHDAVYHILHYLTDTQFTSINSEDIPNLKYAVSFLPIIRNPAADVIFEHIESQHLIEDDVKLVGANFGIKESLFRKYLWSDSIWLIITTVTIFLSIWFYSSSLFITFMTFLAIFWSLVFAYFIYIFVLRIKFFPYMNMVTIMIMVGIGADDTFIYCRLWNHARTDKKNMKGLEEMVSSTLRHATMSMFVSSLTTMAAFLANAISDIIAIRCFSIYVGISVLCNFLLMVSWMPAVIILYENYSSRIHCTRTTNQNSSSSCRLWFIHQCKFLPNISQKIFKEFLPNQLIKHPYVWLFLFGMCGLGSSIVVFIYPGVKLPTKEKFQYFSSDHLLEVYDIKLWNHFWFEKAEVDSFPFMPITVVWGIKPIDNGHILDPYDHGTLVFDEDFSLESAAAQTWLMDFCRRVRQQPFYQNIPGYAMTNCFFENFRNYLSTPCIGKHRKRQGCCNITEFPYSGEILRKCLEVYIPILLNTPYIGPYYSSYHLPGPRFHNKHMRAFFVEFSSTTPFTYIYEKLYSFYTEINEWVQHEMRQAPQELSRGWFVSYLHFFDLQSSILHGLPVAVALSLTVVGIVIFLTTLNVLLSIFALFSVVFTILTTVAFLILLGWELNILESVVITVAIGMSIDFTLHYSVAYRLSPHTDRSFRVVSAISSIGSAIAMASFTTLLAGLLMLPATVLVFRQFGIFLVIIISSSWLYATFFFLPLLCVLGPDGDFCQFRWPSLCPCLKSSTVSQGLSSASVPSFFNGRQDNNDIELSEFSKLNTNEDNSKT